MLVGMVGAPCSGKTTVAAKLFAELKDLGLPTDYVAEQARFYIANKRFLQKKSGGAEDVVLSDDDQLTIARQQFRHELVMSDPRTILITDSSVLNSLLYMSPDFRETKEVRELVEAALPRYDLLFICHPVRRPDGDDPNRIHNEEQSLKIHEKIETEWDRLFSTGIEPDRTNMALVGPSRVRFQEALSAILEEFKSC